MALRGVLAIGFAVTAFTCPASAGASRGQLAVGLTIATGGGGVAASERVAAVSCGPVLTCAAGRNLLRARGYAGVKVISCHGAVYRYRVRAAGRRRALGVVACGGAVVIPGR